MDVIGGREAGITGALRQQQRLRRHQLETDEQQGKMLTLHQARGKWMIPAYKGILYTSLGASMYMMGRLVLVGLIDSRNFNY